MTNLTNRNAIYIVCMFVAAFLLSACKQTDEVSSYDSTSVSSNASSEGSSSGQNDSKFEPVQIHSAPSDQFGFPGQTVSFKVDASSNTELSYQWFHNDGLIDGSNSPTLNVEITGAESEGTYRVNVSNSSTSENASAQLSAGVLPGIVTQPSSVSVYPGDFAIFKVIATGTSPAYQWYKKANGGWEEVSGANSATLLIGNVDVSKAGEYRVSIANAGGSATSGSAFIALKDPVVITRNPAPQQAATGGSASFSAAAAGYGTISYRWYKGNYAIYDGAKYAGATSSTLTIKDVSAGDASVYKVKASNSDRKYAYSSSAQLSVAGPAHVTVQPVNTNLYTGKTGVLTVAASGDAPISYQWQKLNGSSWQNIGGANSATLSFSAVTSGAAGQYRCVVANAVAQNTSADATVTVLQSASIKASPVSATVANGDSVRFSVAAAGDGLQYEWTKNGQVLSATSSVLSFAAAKEVDEGAYGCRVYNGGSSASCSAFSLTVNTPLAILKQPVDQNTYEGGSATLGVEVVGEPAPVVEWFFDGALVATGTSLSLNNIQLSQAGEYRCVVKNATGSINCNPASVTISTSVKISGQPGSTTVNAGNPLSLSVSAVGEGLNYDWIRNGVSLGINNPTLSINSVKSTDEGSYSCRVWNSNSSVSCNVFSVVVNQGVSITSQPQNASAFEDGAVALSVAVTGKPLPVVDWYFENSLVKSNSTTLNLSGLTMAQAGSYQCKVRNSVSAVDCNTVIVNVREKVRITKQLANQTINAGDSIVLDLLATGEMPITYQCYRDGAMVAAGTSVSGLVLPSSMPEDSGSYYCTASNAGSSARTASVSISVIAATSTRSAGISWRAPVSRANGDELTPDEISGYEIYMATSASGSYEPVVTVDSGETTAVVNGLSAGTYYFRITTLDVFGLESEMSPASPLTIR